MFVLLILPPFRFVTAEISLNNWEITFMEIFCSSSALRNRSRFVWCRKPPPEQFSNVQSNRMELLHRFGYVWGCRRKINCELFHKHLLNAKSVERKKKECKIENLVVSSFIRRTKPHQFVRQTTLELNRTTARYAISIRVAPFPLPAERWKDQFRKCFMDNEFIFTIPWVKLQTHSAKRKIIVFHSERKQWRNGWTTRAHDSALVARPPRSRTRIPHRVRSAAGK